MKKLHKCNICGYIKSKRQVQLEIDNSCPRCNLKITYQKEHVYDEYDSDPESWIIEINDYDFVVFDKLELKQILQHIKNNYHTIYKYKRQKLLYPLIRYGIIGSKGDGLIYID